MKKEEIIKKYLPKGVLSHAIHDNVISYEVSCEKIISLCEEYTTDTLSLKMITACDETKESGFFKIYYIFGFTGKNIFLAPYIRVTDSFPSLTLSLHQASIYERKIYSMFGLIPHGHPHVRSLLLHDENWPESNFPLRKDFMWNHRPDIVRGSFPFREVGGEGIYEIPVGPVHAGIIEPGHFRLSVVGEEILHLEPRLGYSHKGSEKLFEIFPLEQKILLAERISGDSSFSHSLAFCQAVESLGEIKISEKTGTLRVIFCELERLANHFGDMGAIMLDTGFNFGGAHGARLREIVMQLCYELCGNRFLRGLNGYGSIKTDIDSTCAKKLLSELEILQKDFSQVMHIAENNSSLIERLQGTGTLSSDIARDHGVVGVTARACGFEVDARIDFPYAAYGVFNIPRITEKTGDVYARFYVRLREVYASFDILQKALNDIQSMGNNTHEIKMLSLKKNVCALSVVEGWRGEIATFITTDSRGAISRVDVRDPSFLNWTVVGHAGRGNMVPDFPLINKSFNLSYSGNDL